MTQQAEVAPEAQSGEHRHTVSITIDGTSYDLRPGEHPVAEIRKLGNVPADYELEEVVGGKFVPIPDGGKVHIKGGEIFISHPKDASSS